MSHAADTAVVLDQLAVLAAAAITLISVFFASGNAIDHVQMSNCPTFCPAYTLLVLSPRCPISRPVLSNIQPEVGCLRRLLDLGLDGASLTKASLLVHRVGLDNMWPLIVVSFGVGWVLARKAPTTHTSNSPLLLGTAQETGPSSTGTKAFGAQQSVWSWWFGR